MTKTIKKGELNRELTREEAEIAIALADRQQEIVAFALKNQEKLPILEVIAEREKVVREFRESLRQSLLELAKKGGASLKQLGMKAIQLCQAEIKGKRDILLENELAHAFYEENVHFYSTFLGELSKDLLRANRENICFILKLVKEKPQQGLEKSGQFFQGVGSRIASIEYQEKIEQVMQRIEEIYQNVLKNYKEEFIPESQAIIEDGLKAARVGTRMAKKLAGIILERLRQTDKPDAIPVQQDSL